MKLKLLAAGTRMPAWVREGFDTYAARLPRECRLVLTEIPLGARGKGKDPARAMADESRRMLGAVGPGDEVVALEVKGRPLDTPGLARRLEGWLQGGRDVSLLIGGPDGLHPDCRERAGLQWSLSPLTLPHALVRILVAEQLYRAWSILHNHPYHRE